MNRPTIGELIFDKLMDNPYPEIFEVSKVENPEFQDMADGQTSFIEFVYDEKFVKVRIFVEEL